MRDSLMNREIKFRGKSVKSGKWVYGSYIHFVSNNPQWLIESHDILPKHSLTEFPVIPETVGEFTGLKDKERSRFFPHGKDIYEGDILVEWFGGKRLEWSTWRVVIENCTSGRYCCVPKNHVVEDHVFKPFFCADDNEWEDMDRLEVIGNVHQHVEILK